MSFISSIAALPALPKYTEADLLALFDRLLPEHYLWALKEPGPGYELFRAFAAVNARVSEAVSNVGTACYVSNATGGSYATGVIEFFRDTAVYGAVTLKAGTIVGTVDGYKYATLTDAVFGASDLGPIQVNVQATVRGWLYNKPAQQTAADGSTIPGSIDRLLTPVLPAAPPAPNFDPTIQVRHIVATTGGVAPMLDGLGSDRNVTRFPNESDESYRVRVALLPETVTPEALANLTQQVVGLQLEAAGYIWSLYETWDLRVQTSWDWTPNQTLTEAELNAVVPAFNANVFVWDYAPAGNDITAVSQPGSHSNRWFDAGGYNGGLIVALPNLPAFLDRYTGLFNTLNNAKPAGITIGYVVMA